MLGVVKHLFSPEAWAFKRETADFDRERLDRLQVGSAVEFGFMPQLALSAKRFKITGVRTYAFDGDKFVSFSMSHGLDHHVNLIVADVDEERYLAISRAISVDEALKLFSAESLSEVMEKLDNERLFCREGIVGFLGWTAPSYRKTISQMGGQVCEGDYREFALPEDPDLLVPFDYTLFVSDNDEFAIEIESYEDGRVDMYATIYRRSTDIARVFPPVKLFAGQEEEMATNGVSQDRGPVLMHATLEEIPQSSNFEMDVHTPVESGSYTAETSNVAELRPEVREETPKASTSVAAKPLPPIVDSGRVPSDLLECDMHVAGKIIDEALRNEMTLNELIRRILGLSANMKDQIYIPLALTEDDFQQLAERYGLDPTNRDELRRQIVEELSSFAGENH